MCVWGGVFGGEGVPVEVKGSLGVMEAYGG